MFVSAVCIVAKVGFDFTQLLRPADKEYYRLPEEKEDLDNNQSCAIRTHESERSRWLPLVMEGLCCHPNVVWQLVAQVGEEGSVPEPLPN